MENLADRIENFNSACKSTYIAFGGDGTFLQAVRNNPGKVIIPVRNYGNCSNHKAEDIIYDLTS